jgi:hypothetical protein
MLQIDIGGISRKHINSMEVIDMALYNLSITIPYGRLSGIPLKDQS